MVAASRRNPGRAAGGSRSPATARPRARREHPRRPAAPPSIPVAARRTIPAAGDRCRRLVSCRPSPWPSLVAPRRPPHQVDECTPLLVVVHGDRDPIVFSGARHIGRGSGSTRRDRGCRGGSTSVPKTSDSIACIAVAFNTVSSIGSSTCCPVPVRSAKFSAASTANAACTPASGSQAPRGVTGGASGSPVTQARPAICSMVGANPTRSRHGPSQPERGHAGDDEFGVDLQQHVGGQPELVHHPR